MVQLYQLNLLSTMRQLTTPAAHVNHANGARKVRGRSGWVWRSTYTSSQTVTNDV